MEELNINEVIKEIITQAHMAGQKESSGCDPSYYSAEVYYQKITKKGLEK